MTWLEIANFIIHEMPECNRSESATVWDGETGKWYPVISVSPFDGGENPSEANFYSVDIDTANCWW